MSRRPLTATLSMVLLLAAACGTTDDGVDLVAVAPDDGECFLAPSDGDTEFEVVPCEDQHGAEVVGRADLSDYESPPERPEELHIDPSSDSRPDDVALVLAATDLCTAPFEEYVGIDYLSSRLTLRPMVPTRVTWKAGEREVVCVVIKLVSPTVGDGTSDTGAVPGALVGSTRGTAQ